MAGSPITFHHLAFVTRAASRSAEFYSRAFGWRLVAKEPTTVAGLEPAGGPIDALEYRFSVSGQRFSLIDPEPDRSPDAVEAQPMRRFDSLGLSHFTVVVNRIPETMDLLEQAGGVVWRDSLSSFIDETGPRSQFLFGGPAGELFETFVAPDLARWCPFDPSFAPPSAEALDAPSDEWPVGVLELSHVSVCVREPSAVDGLAGGCGAEILGRQDWSGVGPSTVMRLGPAQCSTWLLKSGDQRLEAIHFSEPTGPSLATPGALEGTTLLVCADQEPFPNAIVAQPSSLGAGTFFTTAVAELTEADSPRPPD
jgi:catechol 2,3-dioxygenase-like lactoylglutathione lyase family enzyme